MTDKPKILVFIDWYYPGFRAGGPVRSCLNMVNALQNDFDFYIVTRNTDYTLLTPYDGVVSNSWNKRKEGEYIFYISEEKNHKDVFSEILQGEKWDLVYINGVYSKLFSILPLRLAKKFGHKVVVAPRGMFSDSAVKIKFFKKKAFLAMARLTSLYSNVKFHLTSEKEVSDLKKHTGSANFKLAENFPDFASAVYSDKNFLTGSLKLIFPARIAPEKNQEFAIRVLQQVKMKGIEIDFYGTVYDTSYYNHCLREAEKCSSVEIRFHKEVPPEELQKLYGRYDYLFFSSRGENFGHVIAESLLSGTPVIISDQTPWNEVTENGAGFVFNLNDPSAVSLLLEKLLGQSPAEYSLSRKKAEAFALKRMNASVLKEKYFQLFS